MEAGYSAMAKEERKAIALSDLAEALRQGYKAAAQDGILEAGVWDFSFQANTQPLTQNLSESVISCDSIDVNHDLPRCVGSESPHHHVAWG